MSTTTQQPLAGKVTELQRTGRRAIAAGFSDEEARRAYWTTFYDVAGGVGELRDNLLDLLEAWGDADTDDLSPLAMYEALQQIVAGSFGENGAEL